MQVHRTSSSRKLRRKNEWDGAKGQGFNVNSETQSSSVTGSWRVNAKLWFLEQLRNATKLSVAITLALFYFHNTLALFENCTKFSHLTNLERELILPADVAFRYGFFKKIAQAESYMAGLRLITNDQNENDEQEEQMANSFQRYSLAPEAILGSGFHLVKTFNGWFGWPQTECWKVNSHSSRNTIIDEDSFSCSGLGDPLNFYFKSVLALESFVIILIFYLGLEFGKCLMGGIIASGLFIFLHPQRFNYEWLFAFRDKMGWVLVFSQLYCVFRTVFCRVHPPWISTVKIGVVTAFCILFWNTESQWFLSSQILIIAVLHILGYFSRYVTSLVVFGQFTGWQYASLVSLDTSFHHWSFFVYSVVATIVTIFILEPILDWILGKKIEKWLFFRRTILLVTLQLTLMSVRCDFGQMFSFLEDSRFPLAVSIIDEDIDLTWTLKNIEHESIHTEQATEQDFSARLEESYWEQENEENEQDEEKGDFLNENFSDSTPTRDDDSFIENADLMPKGIKNMLSLHLTKFLRACFLHSQAKMSVGKFLSKYFFLILLLTYSIFVCVFMPWVMSKSKSKSSEQKHRVGTESDNFIWTEENEDSSRNVWNFSKRIYSSIYHSLNNCDHHQGINFYRSGSGSDEQGNKRWNSFLTYYIVQTSFFGLFCLSLDKRSWEIFFISHACLIISLLCDFQQTRQTLDSCRLTYANHLHLSTIFVIIGILIASSRVRSTQMYQKSRGRFDIGNPRISSLMEAHQWIKLNTKESEKFAGGGNLMVTLALTTQRHSVNHHLTVHSWARENDDFKFYEKIPSETKSRSKLEKAKLNSESRGRLGFGPQQSRREEKEKVESMKWDGMGGSVGLNSKPLSSSESSKSSWTIRIRHKDEHVKLQDGDGDKRREKRMTSLLTSYESDNLEKIYSLFSRWISLDHFYKDLVSLNVSYLMLSSEQCLTNQTLAHLSTTSRVLSIPTNHQIVSGGTARSIKNHVTTLLDSHSSSAEILLESSFPSDKVLSSSSSISGTWQWNWDDLTQKPHQAQHMNSFPHFSKNCDFAQFWDFVEKKKKVTGGVSATERGGQNFKSHQNSLTKDFDSNVKGSYLSKSQHKINEHDSQRDGKSDEAQRSSTEQDDIEEPTLCCRLLNERNVLPFKRVFQNHFFTILAM